LDGLLKPLIDIDIKNNYRNQKEYNL